MKDVEGTGEGCGGGVMMWREGVKDVEERGEGCGGEG